MPAPTAVCYVLFRNAVLELDVMRRLLIFALMLVFAPLSPAHADQKRPKGEVDGPASIRGCVYFEDAGFAGKSREIPDMTNRRNVGPDWNDRISSVRCSAFCRMIAFEHVDFAGESVKLSGDAPFVGPSWNDRISSIQVQCGRLTPDAPKAAFRGCTMFEHVNFGGRKASIARGKGARNLGPKWNDVVSSIRCTEGCMMTYYADVNYSGDQFFVEGGVSNLGRIWNDRISSAEVQCEG